MPTTTPGHVFVSAEWQHISDFVWLQAALGFGSPQAQIDLAHILSGLQSKATGGDVHSTALVVEPFFLLFRQKMNVRHHSSGRQ
jgi:hypothetical protein